jgi:hypothetical protein
MMMKPIGSDVLAVIAGHLAADTKQCSLRILQNSSFSFENWINAEAYIACHIAGYQVQGPTLYADDKSRLFSDLAVWDSSWSDTNQTCIGEVIIETKIASSGTLNKYYPMIAADWRKLLDSISLSPNKLIEGLQMVFVYGEKDEKSESRQKVLGKLEGAFRQLDEDFLTEKHPAAQHGVEATIDIKKSTLDIGDAQLLAWLVSKRGSHR